MSENKKIQAPIENKDRFNETINVLNGLLKKNHNTIEIGSSDASFKNYFKVDNWTTIDKYGCPDVKADLNGSSAYLPIESSSVDILICTEVLEHLSEGAFLLREINRVLKKDGCAVISVPNVVSLACRIRWLLGGVPTLAASGDLGVPLGGTGIFVDNSWVGSHVVDFNLKRFTGYLQREELEIEKQYKMSATLTEKFIFTLKIPKFLVPKTLGDFILVKVVKKDR